MEEHLEKPDAKAWVERLDEEVQKVTEENEGVRERTELRETHMARYRDGTVAEPPTPLGEEHLDEAGIYMTGFERVNDELEEAYAKFVEQ
jgi:hypothetical protein